MVEKGGEITGASGIDNWGTISEIDDAGTIETRSTSGGAAILDRKIYSISVEKGGKIEGKEGITVDDSGMIGENT